MTNHQTETLATTASTKAISTGTVGNFAFAFFGGASSISRREDRGLGLGLGLCLDSGGGCRCVSLRDGVFDSSAKDSQTGSPDSGISTNGAGVGAGTGGATR